MTTSISKVSVNPGGGRTAGLTPVRLLVLLSAWCALSCEQASPSLTSTEAEAFPLVEAASDERLPDFPAEAVLGVLEAYEGDKRKAVRVLDRSADLPADFQRLLESGEADAEGFVYGDVAGAYSDDGVTEIRYQLVTRTPFERADPNERREKPDDVVVAAPAPPPVIGPLLEERIREGDPAETVEVFITLRERFSTSLAGGPSAAFVSFEGAEVEAAARTERIEARKREAVALQSEVVEHLAELGASNLSGFWLVNGVSATVALGRVSALAEHRDVKTLEMPGPFEEDSPSEWDGDDMKAATGLNAGVFHDNGFHGQAYAGNSGGRMMRIAVIGGGFDHDHPGFLDCAGCGSRVIAYMDCKVNPCVVGAPAPQGHGTQVAGLAAGSVRQGQVAGLTAQEALERTGPAEEPDVYLISIDGNVASAIRSVEWAAATGVDILVSSTNYASTACDSIADGLEAAIYEAQFLNMTSVVSAGNEGNAAGTCSVTGPSEALAAFSVGSAGGTVTKCTDANWSFCPITSEANYGSALGGQIGTVNGVSYSGILSTIAAVAPGCPYYKFNVDGTIGLYNSNVCGTSLAAPQVGSAAIQVKDRFLSQGYTAVGIEGRMSVVLQAMTDRQNAQGFKRTNGFDPLWGGGRFQARYLSASDMGYPYGWETFSAVLSDNQVSNHSVKGAGPEPAGIGQFKSYAMVFEEDNTNIADIDVELRNQDCAAGSQVLASDSSRDVKSMVKLGASASNTALCVRLIADHVPSGQTRRVHVFQYYSNLTSMR